jgi:hypothetical protein
MKRLITLIAIIFAVAAAVFAAATSKEDLYDNNEEIIDTFVVYDPYPSRLWNMGIWIADRAVKYNLSKYVDSEKMYMYVICITDYGTTNKTLLWNEAKKITGTAKSMLLDINNDFENEYFLKAIGLQ